jgi:hypothetical protein
VFGFRFDVGLDPVAVNTARMLETFRRGAADLAEIWAMALEPDTLAAVRKLAGQSISSAGSFHLEDELWARIVIELACAHHELPLERSHLLRSLTPLYLARVASFVIETKELDATQVEEKIEHLCLCFEQLKPPLISRWNEGRADGRVAGQEVEAPTAELNLEV